jgi:hypothetical protein
VIRLACFAGDRVERRPDPTRRCIASLARHHPTAQHRHRRSLSVQALASRTAKTSTPKSRTTSQWCSLSSSVAARTGRFDSTDTGFPTRNMATEKGVGPPVHADRGRTVDAAHPSRTVALHHGQPHHVQHLARVQRGCSQFQPPHHGYRCWRCSLKCQVRRRDRRPSRMRRCSLTLPLPTQCTLLAKLFYECMWSSYPPLFTGGTVSA